MTDTITHDQALRIAEEAVRRYAESRPRPLAVTQMQAADMLGVSRHTVARMVAAGTLRLNRTGLIHVHEIDAALAAPESKRRAA